MSRRTSPGPIRVLHVIHGLGSGVERVVLDYAAATADLEHHAFYSADETCHDPTWPDSPHLTSTRRISGSPASYAVRLREQLAELRPDVVHAHSSVAGALARAVVSRAPVVYTPHCYAFLRRDLPRAARLMIRSVEHSLGLRTDALAACSPHEATLARAMMHSDKVHYVPNIAAPLPPGLRSAGRSGRAAGTRFSVVTSGRVSAQKGATDYVRLARQLQAAGRAVDLTWVGGGDDDLVAELEAAGVRVTGWVSRDEGLAVLAQGDLYVHCALWEAAPVSILEAAELGLPILARDTESLRAMGPSPLWTSSEHLLALVGEIADGRPLTDFSRAGARVRATHSRQAQALALRHCYREALAHPIRRSVQRPRGPRAA